MDKYMKTRSIVVNCALALLCIVTVSSASAQVDQRSKTAIAIHGFLVSAESLPLLGTVTFNLTAYADNKDSFSFGGFGHFVADDGDNFFGNESGVDEWDAFLDQSDVVISSGTFDGQSVALEGFISASTNPILNGLPVRIEATKSGHIKLIQGPFTRGLFAGLTVHADGWGQVRMISIPN